MKEQLFGIFPCLAALRANRRKIHKILVKDDVLIKQTTSKSDKIDYIVQVAKENGVKIEYKPRPFLDKIVGNRPHQNIIMTVSSLKYENLTDAEILLNSYSQCSSKKQDSSLWIALDQVQDPMNLGAILRCAAYFGVQGVIASSKNSCRLSPTVSKASAGVMEWMKIYGSSDLPLYLKQLASNGWEIIGSTMPDDENSKSSVIPCQNLVLDKPSVLVLGNEGAGIQDKVLSSCTKLTTIQSSTNFYEQDLDSLNVSVATGILIHSLLQRK